MKRRKKGATLIFVIIIFMFVCSVSVAMLSMVVGNYRARVSESKRIENLYSSESGIDMAYNISGKTIEAGIKYGYYQVSKLRRGENTGDNYTIHEALKKDIADLEQEIRDKQAEIEITKDEEKVRQLFEDIDKCKKGIETDNFTLNELYKEEFKRAFKVYIQNKENGTENDITVNNTNVLKASIEGKKYIDISLTYKNEDASSDKEADTQSADNKIKEVIARFTEYKVKFPYEPIGEDENGKEQQWPVLSVKDLTLNECPEEDKVQITNNYGSQKEEHSGRVGEVKFDKTKGEYYNLLIESEFLSTEGNEKLGKNIRRIQAVYKLLVPNYEDVLWSSSNGKIKNYSILKGTNERGLIIGGNMEANKISTLNVKGDIFVQGNSKSDGVDYGKVYNKYKGGIKITDCNTVNFQPAVGEDGFTGKEVNVSTRGTFNIQNNSAVTIGSDEFSTFDCAKGNLYAANIYAGYIAKESDELIDNSKLIVNNNVVLDNDLTIKAKNTDFKIQNFFGVNDKNVKYDDKDGNTKERVEGDIEKTSSSIIINGYKDIDGSGESTVSIVKSAYIMGTAHIDTNGDYKTGESIAVKGNYTAYAVPVNPSEIFKIDSSLQVLDDKNENNIFNKAEHFTHYWNGEGEAGIKLTKGNADNGGIILPDNPNDIHSIGAIVCKKKSSSDPEKDQTIVRSSNYSMEDEEKGGIIYNKRADYAKHVYKLGVKPDDKDHDYMEEYLDGEAKAENVSSLLCLLTEDVLPDTYNWREELNKARNGEKTAIFNPTEEPIEITQDMNAFIVTNGDVKISGNVKFKGNIIAKGNLIIENGNNVAIEYDKKTAEDIQEEYGDIFAAIFGQFEVIQKKDEESTDKTELKQLLDGQYDIKRYLEKKLWKLIL